MVVARRDVGEGMLDPSPETQDDKGCGSGLPEELPLTLPSPLKGRGSSRPSLTQAEHNSYK